MKVLIGALLAVASQLAAAQTIPILMYHRVVPDTAAPAHENVQVTRFEEHLKMLSAGGYTTLTVGEMTSLIHDHMPLPTKAVVITFDDGWRSNLDAHRLLSKYNQKATFFVLSGVYDDPAYLSKAQLAELASHPNVEIGAHTHTHFVKYEAHLEKMDTSMMVGEMSMSKIALEKIIKKPITSFAWPYGYVRGEARQYAEGIGFTAIVETNRQSRNGVNTPTFELQRLNVDGHCTAEQVKRMVDTGVLDKCK